MNSKLAIASILAAALATSGCVIVAGDFGDTPHFTSRGDIMGSVVDTRGVTITARSNGCTDKTYFDVDVDRDDGVYEVSFDRDRTDNCRAFLRDGVELTWSYEELGIPRDASIVVLTRSRG